MCFFFKHLILLIVLDYIKLPTRLSLYPEQDIGQLKMVANLIVNHGDTIAIKYISY